MNNYDTATRMLMNLLVTLQVVNDEIDGLPRSLDKTVYKQNLKYEHNMFCKAVDRYRRALKEPNETLSQIWANVPVEDLAAFVDVKARLIRRLQNANFEDINEMDQLLSDAQRKVGMLDIIEKILNTHVAAPVRDMYRQQMGYTEEQYRDLKSLNAK